MVGLVSAAYQIQMRLINFTEEEILTKFEHANQEWPLIVVRHICLDDITYMRSEEGISVPKEYTGKAKLSEHDDTSRFLGNIQKRIQLPKTDSNKKSGKKPAIKPNLKFETSKSKNMQQDIISKFVHKQKKESGSRTGHRHSLLSTPSKNEYETLKHEETSFKDYIFYIEENAYLKKALNQMEASHKLERLVMEERYEQKIREAKTDIVSLEQQLRDKEAEVESFKRKLEVFNIFNK